jgi:hypothetical protein
VEQQRVLLPSGMRRMIRRARATSYLIVKRYGERALLAAMVIIAAFAGVIWLSGGATWRFPREIRPVLATMSYSPRADARMACWLDNVAVFERYAPECKVGTTLIWGDSHAARLSTGLTKTSGGFAQLTRDSCPPVIGFAIYPACDESNKKILDLIEKSSPKRVILFAAWLSYSADNRLSSEYAAALDITLRRVRRAVPEVIVIGPAPIWMPNLPELAYIDWHLLHEVPDRIEPEPINYRDGDEVLAVAAKANGARFVSIIDELCNSDGCLTHTPASHSDLIAWDYGHLTTNGARFVADLSGLN